MGAAGVCWVNAVAENFFSHLKTELYHESFASGLASTTAVLNYIECWYNRRRSNRRAGGIPSVTGHSVKSSTTGC